MEAADREAFVVRFSEQEAWSRQRNKSFEATARIPAATGGLDRIPAPQPPSDPKTGSPPVHRQSQPPLT
eukprot:5691647-Pyramimonas_sp.AAC.2